MPIPVSAVRNKNYGIPFSPLGFPNLTNWYDFSDRATLFQDVARTNPVISDSQTIAGVLDKSGNARHLSQPSGTAVTAYKVGIKNGLSVSLFDSTSDYYDITQPIVTRGLTVFIAFQRDNAASNYLLDSPSNNAPALIQNYNANQLEYFTGGQRITFNTGDSLNWCIASFTGNASTLKIRYNGVQITSVTPVTSLIGLSIASLGRPKNTNNDYYGGYVGELIMYDDFFDDTKMAAIESSYLNSKWKIY